MLLLAAVLLIVLTIVVVSYPLVFQSAEPYALSQAPAAEFSERDALLDAIDELEHAFHSGKVAPADYEAARSKLEVQYIDVLEAEETQGATPKGRP